MIIDTFERASCYDGLHPWLRRAFEFLTSPELANRPCGRYELEGSRLYVNIEEYTTKPLAQGLLEAHRRYLDIQMLITGTEQIGWAPLANQTIHTPYDATRDIGFYRGDFECFTLQPGRWMLFLPQDAHAPQLAFGNPALVRKAVAKVALDF